MMRVREKSRARPAALFDIDETDTQKVSSVVTSRRRRIATPPRALPPAPHPPEPERELRLVQQPPLLPPPPQRERRHLQLLQPEPVRIPRERARERALEPPPAPSPAAHRARRRLPDAFRVVLLHHARRRRSKPRPRLRMMIRDGHVRSRASRRRHPSCAPPERQGRVAVARARERERERRLLLVRAPLHERHLPARLLRGDVHPGLVPREDLILIRHEFEEVLQRPGLGVAERQPRAVTHVHAEHANRAEDARAGDVPPVVEAGGVRGLVDGVGPARARRGLRRADERGSEGGGSFVSGERGGRGG